MTYNVSLLYHTVRYFNEDIWFCFRCCFMLTHGGAIGGPEGHDPKWFWQSFQTPIRHSAKTVIFPPPQCFFHGCPMCWQIMTLSLWDMSVSFGVNRWYLEAGACVTSCLDVTLKRVYCSGCFSMLSLYVVLLTDIVKAASLNRSS